LDPMKQGTFKDGAAKTELNNYSLIKQSYR